MLIQKILLKLRLRKIVSASTFKNISTLMTGTFIATIIPILTAPIMSRIFTVSDYGVLGIYMAISGLIGVLAYSHYAQAILLPKENDEAKQVLWFSLFCSLIVSFTAFLIFILFYFFTNIIIDSALQFWYFFIPVSILLNGISAILIIWANRHQKYLQLSLNRIFQAIITVIVQITLGILFNNEVGLMVGLLTGQGISVILLLNNFMNSNDSGIGLPKPRMFKNIAYRYKNLLIYNTPSEFINNLINQSPIFLLQKFGGLSYVGNYNFTQRFLGLPQIFLSSAIVDVFKQKASYSFNYYGNCKEVFLKTLKILVAIAILPFIIIVFFAPSIFSFVFGTQWYDAGIFAQFMGIMFFFRFIVSPLTYVYIIAGKLREDFILHILFLILTTLSFYVSDYFFEDKRYLILIYSISYSLVYLIYLGRSYIFSKGKFIYR